MKERPILFSGSMVRAILDGKKTQTRRIIKPPPYAEWMPEVGVYHPTIFDRHGEAFPGDPVFGAADEVDGRPCPYGQPGDRLWVRETFADEPPGLLSDGLSGRVVYRADYNEADYNEEWHSAPDRVDKWTPSIHMPRWASRISLHIKEIRVERLQDISEEDALAEGLQKITKDGALFKYGVPDLDGFRVMITRVGTGQIGNLVQKWRFINYGNLLTGLVHGKKPLGMGHRI